MHILLAGLNYRTTPVDIRECVYINREQTRITLSSLVRTVPQISEAAILSTCNRLEVYTVVEDLVAAEKSLMAFLCDKFQMEEVELRSYLYFSHGRLAVNHLMRVACGLDSMIIGESQILGQVSEAINCAVEISSAGTLIRRLFDNALHAGRRARTETAISENTTSVSHAAARLVVQSVQVEDPYVIVIGAGEMAKVGARALSDAGLRNIGIVNRTYEHGERLARTAGGQAYAWPELWVQLQEADAVISATGAPHIVLFAHDIDAVVKKRSGKKLVFVDIAVPRDIDPGVSQFESVTYFDIDDLKKVVDHGIAQRESCIPDVESIITEEEDKYWLWLSEREIVPVIQELRGGFEQVVDLELQNTLNKLGHLSETDQETVRRLAHRIVQKILHVPTVTLRKKAAMGSAEDYAEVVRDLFSTQL